MAIDINIESQVSQTITDGVTTKAPSENAVFDALALKIGGAVSIGQVAFGTASGVGGDAQLFWDNTNKRLGVGTSTPSTKLTIQDSNTSILRLRGDVGSGGIFITQPGNNSTFFAIGDDVNILGSTVNTLVTYFSLAPQRFFINGAERVRIAATGNVGIGTSTPTARLDVQAQGALSTDIAFRIRNSANTQNSLTVNGAGDVYNNGNGGGIFNTFFGEIAGRNATGIYNSGFGYQSLMNTTTGSNNTAFGLNTLRLNTTGRNSCAFGVSALGSSVVAESNTAFGYLCLTSSTSSFSTAIGSIACESQTTGGQNVAIGHGALNKNTTGSNNSILGTNALVNATGSNNVCLGQNAARDFSGGINLTLLNNSVIIGQDAKTNANNETNQIVIGHNAIGLGSNTATLGNTSIVDTVLRGRVNLTQYATGSRPTYVKGALIYDSTLGKLLVGGNSGWEVVTSI
jgi:hypothetical protein